MATSRRLQNSFSGGEISSRMLLRQDIPEYQNSLLRMVNWVPTLQGTAERAPGSQFIEDTGVPRWGRIVPFKAKNQDVGILLLTENTIKFNRSIVGSTEGADNQQQIVVNSDLGRGQTGEWEYDPPRYIGGSGDELGLEWGAGGIIAGNCRYYKYPNLDKDYMDISTTAEVVNATDNVLIEYALSLTNFFVQGDYTLVVKVGTTLGGDEVYTRTWDNPNQLPPNSVVVNAPIPGGAYTGTLFVNIHVIALTSPEEKYSQPTLALNYFRIWAAADPALVNFTETTTYTAAELADIHYVASPYDAETPIKAQKPVIFVHPNHEPSWFFWDGDAANYKFRTIGFTNTPTQWGPGNYPSTCTAVQGRLVLGGVPSDPETVWMTRVAEWNKFDDLLNITDVTPEDSIEFTSTYRSPIRWMSGHKNLLVGTDEIEYIAFADGIFQPSDLGVSVQTTHGGSHVQPVGFGPAVLFSAEGGNRVRQALFSVSDDGWVAADLNLWHPDLFASGIVRMVRMRNPHQMLVVVMGDGQLAILHQDNYANITGWSRMTLNAKIIDACVLVDSRGIDVLYVLVQRSVNGSAALYIEAFANWTDFNTQEYLSSHTVRYYNAAPTNIIDGLGHLEGAVVQVVGDDEYLGSFTVTGGQITLVTQVGTAINVSKAVVGRSMASRMTTLPPPGIDPGGSKRYVDVSVRVRGSTIPIINGERPRERLPEDLMNTSPALHLVGDFKVAGLGFDSYQLITIEETVPLRSEILGVYGKLEENSI